MTSVLRIDVDTETVQALQRGSRKAQEQIYRLFSPAVYTMAIRVLRNKDLAEDVTQDTFVDVLTKAHSLKEPTKFKSWLHAVATNRCLSYLRSAWFRKRANTTDKFDEVETRGVSAEDAVAIDQLLARLPAKSRLVIWLYCIEGMTHDEIAGTLHKSPSFSKSIVKRARDTYSRFNASESRTTATPSFISSWNNAS